MTDHPMRATYGDGRPLPPPLARHDYDTHPTPYTDDELVRLLNPEELQQARRDRPIETSPSPSVSLPKTARSHREETVTKILESLDGATRLAETARDWAAENGYRVGDGKTDNVVAILDDVVSRCLAARHLIDTHEAR